MSHLGYTVGSATAGAIAALDAFERSDYVADYRTVDLINAADHSAQVAAAVMATSPAEARLCLIHGASRMLAAADRLAAEQSGHRAANVVALRVVS